MTVFLSQAPAEHKRALLSSVRSTRGYRPFPEIGGEFVSLASLCRSLRWCVDALPASAVRKHGLSTYGELANRVLAEIGR